MNNTRYVDGRIPVYGAHHCRRLLKKLFSIGYIWIGTDEDDGFKNICPSVTIMSEIRWLFLYKTGYMNYCRDLTDGAKRTDKIYRFVKQPKNVIKSKCQL